MHRSITQEYEYGCGVACFAFAVGMTYRQAATYLGLQQAQSDRFWCKDLALALSSIGQPYITRHIKPTRRIRDSLEGTIVVLRRSKRYPVGHYLIMHRGFWMDPWINLAYDQNIKNAKSGFRKRLPGKPMYILIPL